MDGFQFQLDDFPIPSILADCATALTFRAGHRREAWWSQLSVADLSTIQMGTRPVSANAGAFALFEAADLTALNDPACFRSDFWAWFGQALEMIGSGTESAWAETIIHSTSGRAIPALGRARAIRGPSGAADHILWSFVDVSALKRAEAEAREARAAAEAANAAKSIFLATMSHEIRTPLNGVLGMAQAMEADALPATQRGRLSVIRESGEALLAILNDVLDLSKIEAGRLDLEEIEFDLDDLVRGAHAAFTALANKKSLSFCLRIKPSARGAYRGDPARIRQILYNLISNSLKFTEQGEIRVEVSRTRGSVRFAVADTGVGIAADQLPNLFAKFTQADSSTTRRFGGSGLGLAICRELAGLMGGSIEVESQPGVGSRFVLSLALPRVTLCADTAMAPTPAAVLSSPPAGGLRVLAAEDNSVNQLVLRTLLHQIGVEPHLVSDGAQAVEAWRGATWDLILMDVQMPRLDGIGATRAIRRLEARLGRGRTPIVALSANVMAHQVAGYLAAGMDGHVGKPIDARKLFAALTAAIDANVADGAAPAG